MPGLSSLATAAPQGAADAPPNDDPRVSDRDVCRRFGMTRRQLNGLVYRGRFPPPDVRLSKRLWRWKESTIQCWLDEQGAARKGGGNG